ncbi:Scavenger receptor cysteine-rich type 1 protein, partial [Armadillidium nasatum]
MQPQKLYQFFLFLLVFLILIVDGFSQAEERKGRRRRRLRRRNGQQRGPRRIRHAGQKSRLEFVRRRLTAYKRINETEDGKIRLVDGRAEWEDKYWMDNLFCYGTEKKLVDCRHDGWGRHDCENDEAAGVVCEQHPVVTTQSPTTSPPLKDAPKPIKKDSLL